MGFFTRLLHNSLFLSFAIIFTILDNYDTYTHCNIIKMKSSREHVYTTSTAISQQKTRSKTVVNLNTDSLIQYLSESFVIIQGVFAPDENA